LLKESSVSTATTGPTWQQIRQRIGVIAKERGEYAGLPCPVEEAPLVVAEGQPAYGYMHGFQIGQEKRSNQDHGCKVLNSWRSHRPKARFSASWEIITLLDENGKHDWGCLANGPMQRIDSMLKCLGISQTMDIEAERRAMKTLAGLIPKHLYDGYEMTGVFLETSKRSGVTYIFRRLATTIAVRQAGDELRFLAAMCLHPMAYYEGLPMGAMVPTDDVISHLVMMRADEHLLWRKANQHGAQSPGAML
jgi:hypothetical protein